MDRRQKPAQGHLARRLMTLLRDGSLPAELVSAEVRGGTVRLWGRLVLPEDRATILAAVRRLPGVTAVEDHLELGP